MLLKKTKLFAAGKRAVTLTLMIVILTAVLLSGCSKQQPTPTPTPTESQTEPQTKSAAQLQLEEYIQTAIQCVRENPVDGWSSEVSYPYDKSNTVYSELSDEQKALYDEMLPKVRDMEPFDTPPKNTATMSWITSSSPHRHYAKITLSLRFTSTLKKSLTGI